jgi:hypothetical protein
MNNPHEYRLSNSAQWGYTLPKVKGVMGLGQPILVQWPSLECFTLSAEERFCLLVRLARPFQCQKVNSTQDPKFQRLVGQRRVFSILLILLPAA